MWKQKHPEKGFTVVEILLAFAFVAVAAGIAAPVLYSFQARNDLDVAESVLVQKLRTASMLARSGARDSSWGVRVGNGMATLFQGGSYVTRNLAEDENFTIPDSISSSGNNEVVFTKLAGIPGQVSTLTLMGYGKEGRQITVNSMGTIGSSVIVPPSAILPPSGSPELAIIAPAAIADAGTYGVGNVSAGVAQNTIYTIQNTGTAAATLAGTPRVVVTPISNIDSVAVTVQPPVSVGQGTSANFTISYTPSLPGAFSFTISFANNDADENPYNWTVSGNGIADGGTPEMNATYLGANIVDGAIRNVGLLPAFSSTPLDFMIQNTGTGTLFLNGTPKVVVAPIANISDVSVVAFPTSGVASGGNSTFTISVTPANAGIFRFSVSLANTDSNENPYNWIIRGTGE